MHCIIPVMLSLFLCGARKPQPNQLAGPVLDGLRIKRDSALQEPVRDKEYADFSFRVTCSNGPMRV